MDCKSIYVYGFGNPGRQDDGLGPMIIDKLESENIEGITTDSNYQLNIEDADNIAGYDFVVFVDASIDACEPFSFGRIEPSAEITFTTHSMSPESVIALCGDIHGMIPETYVLAIRGYEWEMFEGLSEKAISNFDAAYSFLLEKIEDMLTLKKVKIN
ncbi:MAG TPA: hydrogenase maturation protease [Spirochaetota bacterium]|nr:hydrogenase maturation protease [Spirochaetota bacterium]HPF05598.1 hydrogenase maturation protease [Spirochaetota bacterium]HPR36530.1 hydrogenase maturation protease [Spirochaetota bacterium]HRX47029.1 hydrogenase maturation protease [Spirochaetota bacterium]